MNAFPDSATLADPSAEGEEPDLPDDWLLLSDPDISPVELELVQTALKEPRLTAGPMVQAFEQRWAARLGRAHGVAVSSGTAGMLVLLRALGIGPGDEVIATPYSWHQVQHAVTLAGATLKLADINYWTGCLDPAHAQFHVTPRTRAMIAGNVNGHPADWNALRALADEHHLTLIEDSTEAIGSVYRGREVGSFGDAAVFDFSQPSALCCGEGGIVVTDDATLATELRYLRARSIGDRRSVSVGSRVPMQAMMSEPTAALAAGQLARIDEILERRHQVERWYLEQMQTFEGIKPPYVADGVEHVNWMLYTVHLGKRFTQSACAQIIEDMAEEMVEAVLYCQPLHQQFHYQKMGYQRQQFPLTERISDRAISLPFHGHLTADHVRFIVKVMKDSSLNVGAGAAIY